MSEKLQVNEPSGLMDFLSTRLPDWARKTLKQRLQSGCISVNGTTTTQHNFALSSGDIVEVSASIKVTSNASSQLEILYSDRDLIAINKPAGLLSVGTDKET